jgi:hypothetical protein
MMPALTRWMMIALAGTALPAQSATFPPIAFIARGSKEVTRDTLAHSPFLLRRQADPSGFLSVTADFNGDGRNDEARILAHPTRGDAMVVIVIQSPEKVDTYVLNSMPIGEIETLGIRLAPATGSGDLKNPGLIVFRFDGAAELNVLRNGEFERLPLPAATTSS